MQTILDTAFWASLRKEENHTPLISLAYVSPEHLTRSVRLERPLRLQAQALTRLAPAVERPGIHLGVRQEGEQLFVWGATRNLPEFCFVVEVVAPGLLVIKQSRGEESGKFNNIAVLEGDEVKVMAPNAAMLPDCPAFVRALFDRESQSGPQPAIGVLMQLAVSMRAHGRGGSLLIVPESTAQWQESILQPITYAVESPFSLFTDASDFEPDDLRRAVDGMAGVTAVDGATIITNTYELLAFGAKIVRRSGCERISRVLLTEPTEGTTPVVAEPSQLGGTRHLSAAQFAHDQRDAIALVASQDGRFTVFGWSPCEDIVYAHRIEALLM